jgi:hypothetical protein
MLVQCVVSIARAPLTSDDYRYAFCGREMWERPSPLAGYFTTCGNLHGDGTLAYRVAGLPLTLERLTLLATDHFRKPEDRLYSTLNGSAYEARHETIAAKWLIRLPFTFFALWLGGGLWWVARRLFGNEGGTLALALYVFCPTVLRAATVPNNEILALWGLYGLTYTCIGVAHALQGPRRKWKPRILLLTLALGLTLTAHLLAAVVGFLAGTAFFYYLAERRRSYVAQIMIFAALGAVLIDFASFSFRISAFTYVFTGGALRFWFSLDAARHFITSPGNAAILVAAAVSLVVYLTARRSRYFGNTTPLLMTLALLPLYTTQEITEPLTWALPFLFTFIGGVFADVLEGRQRRLYLLLGGGVVLAQAAVSVAGILGMPV